MSNKSLRDAADRAAIALFFFGAFFFSMFVIMLGFNAIEHASEKACVISSCINGTLILQSTEPMRTGKFDDFNCDEVVGLTYYRCFPWHNKLYLHGMSEPSVALIVCASSISALSLIIMIGAVCMCYSNAKKYPMNDSSAAEPAPEPTNTSVNIQLEEV